MTDDRPMTVVFPAPADRLNMNDRSNWRVARRLTRAWRDDTTFYALQQLGRTPSERRRDPAFVRVTFEVRDPGRRRDPHNMAPTEKAIVDGLVLAGVWPDDDERFVSVLPCRFVAPGTGHRAPRSVVTGRLLVAVQLFPRAGVLPE